ncbi:MAG: VOC family protein [Firmicutes bacterium]|nr:VOC family protein [Bacillota bacterium]MBQ4504485.1 VOC family protein [Bacillota bacterium]MBQ6684627.1 VOC family protein [Bacillota bacterium]
MNLGAMHHVAIIVSDIEKAREFYVKKLGFEVLHDLYRPQQEDYRLDVQLGTIRLEIFGKKNAPTRVTNPEALGLRHLAFYVEDVEAVSAELNSLGIETEPIRIDPLSGQKCTFFRDPDDLPLELYGG